MKNFSKSAFPEPPARRASISTRLVLQALALILPAFAAGMASAQSTSNQPTITTLWAGTADFNQFGLSSLTFPGAGVILEGTAISQFTGKPVRHIWYGDTSNGLCRIDPEIDDPVVSTTPGIGAHNNIIQTCIGTIQAAAFVPTQLAFDYSTNTMYAADRVTAARGIIRLHYIPSGDNGHGTIDPIHVESLMGGQAGRNAAGGCPVVGDPSKAGSPIGAQLDSISVGPDGNLYAGWKRGGYIIRIIGPATFNPVNPDDCANKIQVPLFSADERLGNGHTFGLAWVGHDLFGADNIAPWILPKGDQCLTPGNGNVRCAPTAATEVLGAFIPGPQAGIISDAMYPSFQGNTLYAATVSSVTRIINVANVADMTMNPTYGGTFCFISGLMADPIDLANETLYVGVDCTQGIINGAASIYKVVPVPKAPGPPATPVTVTATAGNGTATVSWIPIPDGQPITSFVVHASFVSNGATVPDVTVNQAGNGVAPRTATVTGLTNGVSYQFTVAAANTTGTSAFSAPSNMATPFAPSAPGAPTNVIAIAGNASVTVAWTPSASDGGSPITGQLVTTRINGVPSGTPLAVGPAVSGANVTGLTNGTAYTFTVHSFNALGSSPESAPSVAVIPRVAPGVPDLAITMSSPASINAGSIVTFTMVVTNNGPQDAALVTITDLLPGNFAGQTATQGICSATGGAFNCNLGGLIAGSSATVTVKVLIGNADVTNKATVLVRDALGNLLIDPNPTNNSASATTTVNVATPPGVAPPPPPITVAPPVAGGGGGKGGGGGGGAAGGGGGGKGGGGGGKGGGGGAAGGGGGGGKGGGGGAAGGAAIGGPGAGGFGPGM